MAGLIFSGCGEQNRQQTRNSDSTNSSNATTSNSNSAAAPSANGAALADVVAAAAATPSLSTLLSLASKFPDIVTALKGSDLTVFAPTNDAFAAIDTRNLTEDQVKTILQYHVLSVPGSKGIRSAQLSAAQAPAALAGGKLFITKSSTGVLVNGAAKVTKADVQTANGSVVHIIDKVLLPDQFGTIVDAVAKRYDLSTLKNAVIAQGLAAPLAATSPQKTVFAPTNAAFNALPSVPSGSTLTKVLTYHVLGSEVLSTDITIPTIAATLTTGQSLTVAPSATGGVTITDSTNTKANVIEADIVTSNGVIHIVDKVLIPKL
jgi:uncharacterized surface protein with fasciclin (FAS1) repeats